MCFWQNVQQVWSHFFPWHLSFESPSLEQNKLVLQLVCQYILTFFQTSNWHVCRKNKWEDYTTNKSHDNPYWQMFTHIQDIPFCVCNQPSGTREIILTTSSHAIYYGRASTHTYNACIQSHNTHLECDYLFKQYVCEVVFMHICTFVLMCQWLCSLCPQSHHLCTQVHLCLAGCESGAGWAAQQNSLLGYTGGGGTNTLGPADQLSRRWGRGQVDLRGED